MGTSPVPVCEVATKGIAQIDRRASAWVGKWHPSGLCLADCDRTSNIFVNVMLRSRHYDCRWQRPPGGSGAA